MHRGDVWGSRLVGRVTATTAALALAGTAVVLMGQGRSGAALEAAADSATAKTTAPSAATIEIVQAGPFSWKFNPSTVQLAVGGTLTVVNNTGNPHTFTSVAAGNNGSKLFNVKLPAGAIKTVGAIPGLTDGVYGFYCNIHPVMTGTLTIGVGGPVPDGTKFERPLVEPPRLHGKHIRIVMRKAKVRVLPHGPRTPMLDLRRHLPRADDRASPGQDTKVTFVNHLPRKDGAVTIHQHGGHQTSKYDGQPTTYLIRHGRSAPTTTRCRDAGAAAAGGLRSTTTTGWTRRPGTTGSGCRGCS